MGAEVYHYPKLVHVKNPGELENALASREVGLAMELAEIEKIRIKAINDCKSEWEQEVKINEINETYNEKIKEAELFFSGIIIFTKWGIFEIYPDAKILHTYFDEDSYDGDSVYLVKMILQEQLGLHSGFDLYTSVWMEHDNYESTVDQRVLPNRHKIFEDISASTLPKAEKEHSPLRDNKSENSNNPSIIPSVIAGIALAIVVPVVVFFASPVIIPTGFLILIAFVTVAVVSAVGIGLHAVGKKISEKLSEPTHIKTPELAVAESPLKIQKSLEEQQFSDESGSSATATSSSEEERSSANLVEKLSIHQEIRREADNKKSKGKEEEPHNDSTSSSTTSVKTPSKGPQ